VPAKRKVRRSYRDETELEEDLEVREWCQTHGVTKDDLRKAVRELQKFIDTLEVAVDAKPASGSATRSRTDLRRKLRAHLKERIGKETGDKKK